LSEKLQKNISEGHRQRLKDRWKSVGLAGFEDYELLEMLLGYALPRKDTKPLAKELIETYGSLDGVWNQGLERLISFKGLSQHSATLLNLVGELMQKPKLSLRGKKLHSPSEVGDYFLTKIGASKEEFMYLVLLDQSQAVLKVVQVEHGIENRAQIYTKRILRSCLDHFATGLILVHNHPSGQLEFSQQDIAFTKHIKIALDAVEIRLLDHLIVTAESMKSMREEDLVF